MKNILPDKFWIFKKHLIILETYKKNMEQSQNERLNKK